MPLSEILSDNLWSGFSIFDIIKVDRRCFAMKLFTNNISPRFESVYPIHIDCGSAIFSCIFLNCYSASFLKQRISRKFFSSNCLFTEPFLKFTFNIGELEKVQIVTRICCKRRPSGAWRCEAAKCTSHQTWPVRCPASQTAQDRADT